MTKKRRKSARKTDCKTVRDDLGRFVNFPGPGRPPSQHRDENGRDSFQVVEEVALGLTQSSDPVYRAQGARLLLAMEKLRSKDVPEDQPTLTPLTQKVMVDYVVKNILKKPEGGPSVTGEEDSS